MSINQLEMLVVQQLNLMVELPHSTVRYSEDFAATRKLLFMTDRKQ